MKKRMTHRNLIRYCFFICFLQGCTIFLHAQSYSMLTANTDNVFASPNARNVIWNVLRNDIPGECEYEELKLTILTPPKHAASYSVNAANRVVYTPVSGYTGRDSLQYQIQCNGGTTSSAWVYIHVNDKPDDMFVDVCYITPPAIGFNMKLLSQTPREVMVSSNILCGDIDNDGESEIIVFEAVPDSNRYGDLFIYGVRKSDSQIYKKYTIPLPSEAYGSRMGGNMSIANIDGNGYAAIFVVTDINKKLQKYVFNGTTYVLAWTVNVNKPHTSAQLNPVIADFAGDGNAQVQISDQIFNAKTGALLVDGFDLNGFSHASYGFFGHAPAYSTSFVAADIDGDGKPELIAGDCVYKVTITNHAGTSGNSMKVIRQADKSSHPEISTESGGVALADVDLDGQLDVIVGAAGDKVDNNALYVYNPRTGKVLHTNIVNDLVGEQAAYGTSLPFAADMDGDGIPEIIINTHLQLRVYKYNPTSQQLELFKTLTTTDASGVTTLTLFDFTQDGKAKLVYRDEDNLRIIDGSTMNVLSTVSGVYSPTLNEYPIVADVNGDGAAEIIVIGTNQKKTGTVWNWEGSLQIYSSAGTPWAPARSVWDRNPYNPVNINDDLTIPRYPVNPATVFTEAATGKKSRPYNNFLQQATQHNEEGTMLWLGADLSFDKRQRPKMIYNSTGTGTMDITIYVTNAGDRDFGPSIRIGTYGYIAATDQYIKIDVQTVTATAVVGNTTAITYSIPDYTSLLSALPAFDHFYICLNAKDNPGVIGSLGSQPVYFYGEEECHGWNNSMYTTLSFGERVMCEGESEWVNVAIAGPGIYKYIWTAPHYPTHPNLPFDGEEMLVTKNSDALQYYLIDVYTLDGVTKLNAKPDTVKIYLYPDSLIWTAGGGTADWNDYDNWYNPAGAIYRHANIPRKCTNVLIPENMDIFPDLNDPSTNYNTYLTAECCNITFEHSARVVRTDLLDYDQAYVQLKLSSNRNYMLSAPLQNFYTGDYYIHHPNPFYDDIIAYTSLHSRSNPQTNHYVEAAWTGLFNNPDYLMGPGSGVRLWVDDKQPDASIQHDFLFSFPKHESTHSLYNKTTGQVVSTHATPRGNEHRFIYEPDLVTATGNIRMDSVHAVSANKKVLVGNPFMAHLDFDAFYQKNNAWIKSTYQIMTESGATITYDADTGLSTDESLTKHIAPMQSFWVESKSAFNELYADVYMTTDSRANEGLRNMSMSEVEGILKIKVSDIDQTTENKTLLVYDRYASNVYREEGEDITSIFMESYPEALSVYTCSSDGYYLDINRIGDVGEIIPVGIHTSLPGKYVLKFEGMHSFPPDIHIWFNEILPNGVIRSVNLYNECDYYEFEKTDTEVYMTNRFYLSFGKAITDVKLPETSPQGIELITQHGELKVYTTDGSRLTKVEIYDSYGRKIKEGVVHGSSCVQQVYAGELYIVRAKSTKESRTFKVIGN